MRFHNAFSLRFSGFDSPVSILGFDSRFLGGLVLTGKAPHSKCGGSNPLGVRVPRPPLTPTITYGLARNLGRGRFICCTKNCTTAAVGQALPLRDWMHARHHAKLRSLLREAEYMGENNSSLTRVVPVFESLYTSDPRGSVWLPYLLSIGSRAGQIPQVQNPGPLKANHEKWWGKKERRIARPTELLTSLVEHVTVEAVEKSGDKDEVLSRRTALAKKDATALKAAHDGIRSGRLTRQWYALEGYSAPDAFFETETLVLVVEGKRTEMSCTTKTKWMGKRSQLLRHMDATVEIAEARRVLGLLLVEGHEPNPLEPSSYWLAQSNAQVAEDMLRSSLPHRSSQERKRLVDGVLGAAT